MADRCEKCGTLLGDKKDRFCRKHARQVLTQLEAAGYLQPLTISTVDGMNQRLSKSKFLSLPSEPFPFPKQTMISDSPAGSVESLKKSPPQNTKTKSPAGK